MLGVLRREDISAHWSGGPAEQSNVQVQQLLGGRRCPHVSGDRPLSVVAATMIDSRVDVVPVIGPRGILEGLITATDVMRAVAGRPRPESGQADVTPGLFRLEPLVPPKLSEDA